MRSVSFAQTVFSELKRFAANDPGDIKAIIAHLVGEGKLQYATPDVVLEYLNANIPEDQKELQAKAELFSQRLAVSRVPKKSKSRAIRYKKYANQMNQRYS